MVANCNDNWWCNICKDVQETKYTIYAWVDGPDALLMSWDKDWIEDSKLQWLISTPFMHHISFTHSKLINFQLIYHLVLQNIVIETRVYDIKTACILEEITIILQRSQIILHWRIAVQPVPISKIQNVYSNITSIFTTKIELIYIQMHQLLPKHSAQLFQLAVFSKNSKDCN